MDIPRVFQPLRYLAQPTAHRRAKTSGCRSPHACAVLQYGATGEHDDSGGFLDRSGKMRSWQPCFSGGMDLGADNLIDPPEGVTPWLEILHGAN